MHYSCVTNIDKLTEQNIGCKQALHLAELQEQHAKGDTIAKGVIGQSASRRRNMSKND